MKRCPKCHRFGVEYDPYFGFEVCLWNDCKWINNKHIDVDKTKHPRKFQEFAKMFFKK